MQYKSFTIKNFKGIKETKVDLANIAGASVFAFVGLNESGKTTILQAIHTFSPDTATSDLVGGDEERAGVPFKDRVPRHLISNFSGNVSVQATLSISEEEKTLVASELLQDNKLYLDVEHLPSEIVFERYQTYENGDFKRSVFTLRTEVSVKTAKQNKWRRPSADERVKIRALLYGLTPDIAYFPTFVFDFPKTIFLTERGGKIDEFYRTVFQDVLDFDGRGYTIEKDIVRRIRGEGMVVPWLSFLPAWGAHDSKDKIEQIMDRAGAAVTKVVLGRWNRIFGEDTRGKEIVITFDTAEGEVVDQRGNITKTQEHDVYIKFQVRDGTRRFNVNDRSLGFRWFFAFMLFTQFRVARSVTRPLLFLFDEPASNLHAAAQQKLIDCFPEIARDEHMLAYTTHSHYMIEPKWLEQTYIVTNRADAPISTVLDEASLDDESLDVKVSSYRSFVNSHPNKTDYFQPILDRLEVVPSRFDAQKSSIVLEGKSDYYILRYAAKLLDREDLPLLPGLGAGTFGALAALHVGWNLRFLFVLDGDRQGNFERSRYIRELGIPEDRVGTIDQLVQGVNVVEQLLDDQALGVVASAIKIDSMPT